MGRREDLVKRVDREAYRAAGAIPPQEVAEEGYEYGPTSSQQIESLYQEQREVQGCLWLVVVTIVLFIAIWLYLLWQA